MVRPTKMEASLSGVRKSIASGDDSRLTEFDRAIRKVWIAMRTDRSPGRAVAAVEYWFRTCRVSNNVTLCDLGLDARTISILEANSVETVPALCRMRRDDLLTLRQIGEAMVDEIEVALSCNGLKLRKN